MPKELSKQDKSYFILFFTFFHLHVCHVHVYIYVLHVCRHMCVSTYVCSRMWNPEVDVGDRS